jgi:hypothetical protein
MLRPTPGAEILEFRVRPYPEGRDRTQSFVVEFTLQEAGYPVVLHLDAEGRPSVLFPERDWIAVGGRSPVRLPDPSSGQAWRLEGVPGEESFLLVVGRDREVDLDLLVEEAERLAARSPTPQDARRRVREFFARNVGPVQEVGSEALRS